MQDIQRVLREAHIAGLKAANKVTKPVEEAHQLLFKFIKQTQLGFFQVEGFTIDYERQTARRSFTNLYYSKAFQAEAIKYGFTVNVISQEY